MHGELTNGTQYEVRFPDGYTATITRKIVAANVEPFKVDGQQESVWISVLVSLLPFVLVFGFVLFFLNQVQGGGNRVMSFGKARTKGVNKDQPKVTFADVAGLDEAVEELQEIKEFLESPAKFQQMGAKIPKGVLLFGPPGTGKTLLAKAVAGEAGVPFFSISGSDFVEMFVGVGASRVRDLFEQAKSAAPAIVFVDEIDAVGRHRGAGLGGGHDEREQTLNQLLVEMDGFDAAHRRDPARVHQPPRHPRPRAAAPGPLRPPDRRRPARPRGPQGRSSRCTRARSRSRPASTSTSSPAARPGFTGADLANLMNEAALLAARKDLTLIGLPQLEEAIDRVIAGPERKSRVISERERRVIAYHEGGHALVAHALPNADPVHKISIIPRGRALGYTLTLPTEDKFLVTRSELVDELAMLLGGRTAEELIFADPTTGAQNDIERATTIARQMVTEFGMSEALGPMRFGQPQGEVFLGRDFSSRRPTTPTRSRRASTPRCAARSKHAHALRARDPRRATVTRLDRLADELIEHETLEVGPGAGAVRATCEPFTGAGTGQRPAAAAATDVSRSAPRRRESCRRSRWTGPR